MELYERIRTLISHLGTSQSAMASALGMPQRTFQGYLNEKRQDNLWPLLPEILEAYPHVARQWLYFEEGPMTIGRDTPLGQPVPLQDVAAAVKQMAEDAKGKESTLLHMVAGLSYDTADGERVKELEQAKAQLEQELAEERRLNRQLTTRLLMDGIGDKGVATNTGKTGEEHG